MTEAELRARLARPRPPPPDPHGAPGVSPATVPPEVVPPPGAIAAPARSDDALDLVSPPLIPAAVLVPIIFGPDPGILLTKRTAHLNAHAGQVSFPGGRIDPLDRSPEDAALREAWEEIGLDPETVELAGRLASYVTGTGYEITPVLGLLGPSPSLMPSADEVEAMFELPLSVLLDPHAPQRRRAHYRGRWREFWVWPHPEHYIWGATAGILMHLAAVLRGPETGGPRS
ncbi:MAG: CoA pyrophosphatase [Acidisphaera sp.]|nr:CoA pyrophosphatase [Acidisphaera sp.]